MDSHSVYQVLSDSNASARGMLRARQTVPQRPDLARAPKSVYKDMLRFVDGMERMRVWWEQLKMSVLVTARTFVLRRSPCFPLPLVFSVDQDEFLKCSSDTRAGFPR